MVSFWNRLKSLKDTLLEYTVFNVDLLFPTGKSTDDIANVPRLQIPGHLFDKILQKSDDMCWPMEAKHFLVVARGRLKWSESSTLNSANLFVDRANRAKTMKAYVILDEPKDVGLFKEILTVGGGRLDDLDLTVSMTCNFKRNHKAAFSDGLESEKVAVKLKRFCLKAFSFDCNTYAFDASRLTTLEHECHALTKRFLDELVGFDRLACLSLFFLKLDDGVGMDDVVDAIVSLKGLRFLSLIKYEHMTAGRTLQKILEGLDDLEVLELDGVCLFTTVESRRPLKLLSFQHTGEALGLSSRQHLGKLANRIGNFGDAEGLMTVISTTPNQHKYRWAVAALLQLVRDGVVDLERLVEAERDGRFVFRSPRRQAANLHSTGAFGGAGPSYGVLSRMVCYGMSRAELRPIVENAWKDFVESNGSTHLAVRFRRI